MHPGSRCGRVLLSLGLPAADPQGVSAEWRDLPGRESGMRHRAVRRKRRGEVGEVMERSGSTPARLAELQQTLRALAPVVVAFSGGVDSSFVLAAAVRGGAPGTRAVLGVSPSLAADSRETAHRVARSLGIEAEEVLTAEMARPA